MIDALLKQLSSRLQEAIDVPIDVEHKLTKGEMREDWVRDAIRDLLPQKYQVASGIVVNSKGEQSLQQDFLNIKKKYGGPFLQRGNVGIFPVEIVVGCIEVKSNINSTSIREGFEKVESVRKLMPKTTRTRIVDMGNGCASPITSTSGPFGALIGLTSNMTIETLLDNFNKNVSLKDKHNVLDLLLVPKTGLVCWSGEDDGVHFELSPESATNIMAIKAGNEFQELGAFILILMERLASYILPPYSPISYLNSSIKNIECIKEKI